MITDLQQDAWTRDWWSDFDAAAIAQLTPLWMANCYKPKFYKAPDSDQELMNNGTYAEFGFTITPGSLLCGFYASYVNNQAQSEYTNYLLQIRDLSLGHDLFSQPVPGVMVQNQQKTATYPNLLPSPYPIVGDGNFLIQIWNEITNNGSQETTRIQVIFAVAEYIG